MSTNQLRYLFTLINPHKHPKDHIKTQVIPLNQLQITANSHSKNAIDSLQSQSDIPRNNQFRSDMFMSFILAKHICTHPNPVNLPRRTRPIIESVLTITTLNLVIFFRAQAASPRSCPCTQTQQSVRLIAPVCRGPTHITLSPAVRRHAKLFKRHL